MSNSIYLLTLDVSVPEFERPIFKQQKNVVGTYVKMSARVTNSAIPLVLLSPKQMKLGRYYD
jgi:hypothetical protein